MIAPSSQPAANTAAKLLRFLTVIAMATITVVRKNAPGRHPILCTAEDVSKMIFPFGFNTSIQTCRNYDRLKSASLTVHLHGSGLPLHAISVGQSIKTLSI